MANIQQDKKSGGAKKYGRNKDKCKRYRDHNTRAKNKIKRVLQSCGYKFAVVWARAHSVALPKGTQRERSGFGKSAQPNGERRTVVKDV